MGILITSEESSGTSTPMDKNESDESMPEWKCAAISETPVDVPPSPEAISEPVSITREKSSTSMDKSDWSKSRSGCKPKLTLKDQKILKLMKAKREAEKAFLNRREKLHLAWDEEQKRVESAKMAMENIRRRRMAAECLHRKQEQEYWENEKKKVTEMETMEKELAAECCSEHRARLISEIQKKKEKNLKVLDKEEEEMRRRIEEKQKEDLKNASIRKMKTIHQNARRLKKANTERFEKCKIQKESLNMQSREGFENLLASLERQHAQVKSNHDRLMKQREMDQKVKRKELELRIEQNRKLQKQLEEEIWNRQKFYNEEKEKERKHLIAAAAKFADLKAKKVREERLSRQKCQIVNMRKVNLCLELWKKKTEENLQGKFKKCEEMQAAKDYQLSQVRASAIESQKMRDKIRQYYDRNNFDKKLLEAELYTKMGNGVQTASKNLSSLLLG